MRSERHSVLTQLFPLWPPTPMESVSRRRSWVGAETRASAGSALCPGLQLFCSPCTRPGCGRSRSLSSLQPCTGSSPRTRPLYVRPGVPAHPARDPAERGIVLSRDPGAYATERAAKMADDEAEQERLSGGGCAAELRRLGERLQELERRLCESREPAVEAAAAYCRQLCQVSPSPSAGLSGRSAGGPRLCVRRPGWAGWPPAPCTLPGCAAGSRLALARRSPGLAGARSRPAFFVGLGSDRQVSVDVLEPIPPDLQAGSGGRVCAAAVAAGCCTRCKGAVTVP
ncbi:hypothetical protein NN561_019328 [Cricetulus griseus]